MKWGAALGVVMFAPAAEASPCLHVREPLDAAWSAAVRAAETELAGECGTSTLTITRADKHVVLEIESPDGRRGERVIERPRELAPIVLGLTASVPELPVEEAPPPPSRESPPPKWIEPERVIAPVATIDAAERLASLGVTFGTRLGLPTGVLSTDVELRGDVRVNRWVISLSGRASPSGSRMGGHEEWEYSEMSVGALGGRVLGLGGGQLSLSFGPRLSMTMRETEAVTKSRRDVVLQAAARFVAPIGDRLRPALAFETEAAPLRLTSDASIPSWSSSLRFGIVGFGP